MSSAECLLHSAAHASHRAPPRPAVNVGEGAHNVATSAHTTRADASRDANVVAEGTHAAGGVAAAEWLAATLGGSVVNAGGSGARTSDVDDGLHPGVEGRDTSASPSSYLLAAHDDDVDVTPLLSLQKAAPGDSGDGGDGDDCAGDDRIATHSSLHDDAMSDDNDDDKVDTLEVILGHVSQREDAGYDDAGEDVSVDVGVSAVVGVGVNGQGVSLGVSLGTSLVVAYPPLTSLDS